MGRKKEMVHGDVFAYLIFFSYIEEKVGRPLGGLDGSRKPFRREFDEYMHERGEVNPTAFDKRQSAVTTQARVSVRNTISGSVSAVFCFCFPARDLVVFFFFLHTYTRIHLLFFSHTLCGSAQRLRFQISRISRDREYPQCVRVSKAALPALHSNDRTAWLDQAQSNCAAQSKSDAIIHLGQ